MRLPISPPGRTRQANEYIFCKASSGCGAALARDHLFSGQFLAAWSPVRFKSRHRLSATGLAHDIVMVQVPIESCVGKFSTCTIVVMVFRKTNPSERFVAETRRKLGSFRWEHQVLAIAIASGPNRRRKPHPKTTRTRSYSPICPPQVYAGRSSSGTNL